MSSTSAQLVHLIGVCGSGMSALAHILIDRGFKVSGSDLRPNHNAQELIKRGMTFFPEHKKENIAAADVVVASGAVPIDNPELHGALARQVPVFRRAEFLAKTLSEKKVILVCGSHGKSSTTAMLAKILSDCGKSPAYYIGGNVPDLGRPGAWGDGLWAVVEGDESDGSADVFCPAVTVLLNADWEHVDHFRSLAEVEDFFVAVAKKSSLKVVCCADAFGSKFLARLGEKTALFGTSQNCDIRYIVHDSREPCPLFTLITKSGAAYTSKLSIAGVHQVSNATGALLTATLADCEIQHALKSVAAFSGVDRRLQRVGDCGGVRIYSDYAHHPAEVRVTVETARHLAPGRLLAVFQPHRYTRSQALSQEYGPALLQADIVFLTDIYPAGEARPEGFSGVVFADAVRHGGARDVRYCSTLKRLRTELVRELQPGDTVLIMGAGDIHQFALDLAMLKENEQKIQELVSGRGRLKTMYELASRTTLKIGGPADFYIEPQTVECAADVLKFARRNNMPVIFIGRGSNLLIKDGGIRGIVLHLPREHFSQISLNGNHVTAGAATRLKELVYFAMQKDLGGIEFLEGIPGSLGGALRMNAGAMGAWIFDVVTDVTFLNEDGQIITLPRSKINAGYRSAPELAGKLVISATLQCRPESKQNIMEKIRQYSSKRWQSQPSMPSAGCFFKNPDWGPAGKLIDITNLKGLTEGGASVSTVHGNFLVNNNNATALDMLRLMDKVKNIIRQQHGIELENEVIIIGEDA
jgi:UDP-N-acetylmuramate--L-alanine ligase/UDP-N-acetylenolpyruvoylglucosamine reductase